MDEQEIRDYLSTLEGNGEEKPEYSYTNKCKYTGQWDGNKRHGKGIFRWPADSSGTIYVG